MAVTKQKIWTYKDYYDLNDDKRYEVIAGELIEMPSPRKTHQEISVNLTVELGIYLRKYNIGKIYVAPFDTILSDINTVQPDILFILQKNLNVIQERGLFGTPDLIIEILSPSNKSYDKIKKFKLYEKFKVKELWIIDPDNQSIEIYTLQANQFVSFCNSCKTTKVKSTIFTELELSFADLITE